MSFLNIIILDTTPKCLGHYTRLSTLTLVDSLELSLTVIVRKNVELIKAEWPRAPVDLYSPSQLLAFTDNEPAPTLNWKERGKRKG